MAGLTRQQRQAQMEARALRDLEYGQLWRDGETEVEGMSQLVTDAERAKQRAAIESMLEDLVDEDAVLRAQAQRAREAAEHKESILAEARARIPTIEELRRRNTEKVWLNLVGKLRDPENRAYRHWGGAGVRLADRWLSIDAFIEDVGLQPSPRYELVRADVRGAFEPGNAGWREISDRRRAKTDGKHMGGRPKRGTQTYVEYEGQQVTLPELAKLTGVKYQTIMARWYSGKRKIEQLTLPVHANARGRSYATSITDKVTGAAMTIALKDLCRVRGVNYSTAVSRLNQGKSMEEALQPPRKAQTHEERKAKQRQYWHARKARKAQNQVGEQQ